MSQQKKKQQPHTELQRLLQSTSFAMMLATPKCQVPPFPSIYLITPYRYNSTDPVVIFSSFISNENSYQNTEKLYPVLCGFGRIEPYATELGRALKLHSKLQFAPRVLKTSLSVTVATVQYSVYYLLGQQDSNGSQKT